MPPEPRDCLVALVRHCEASDGEAGSPRRLTDAGRARAAEVGRALAGFGAQRLLSSPAARAVETAEAIGAALGLPVEVADGLRGGGRAAGAGSGGPHEQDDDDEDPAAVVARIERTVAEALAAGAQRIVAVSHGRPHNWVLCAFHGVAAPLSNTFEVDEGGFSVLRYTADGDGVRLAEVVAQGGGRCPVIDFDHTTADYAENWIEHYAAIRAAAPVGWSPRHGGFWVVSRYREVAAAARDDESFSSDHDVDGTRNGYQGVGLPVSVGMRSVPMEVDPPEFFEYRRLLNPRFTRAACAEWRPWLDEQAHALIDKRIESGRIDFAEDLAIPLPSMFMVSLLGLPLDEWRPLTEPFHRVVTELPGTAEHADACDGLERVFARLRAEVAARRGAGRGAAVGDDLTSHLAAAEVGGRPLNDDEVVGMLQLMLFGGVDSTTALIAQALLWLDGHPAWRGRLADDAALRDPATEEFLRYFSPVPLNGRTVTRDMELGGARLHERDRLFLSWAAANHDPEAFEAPDAVVLDRAPNHHAAFGIGLHYCIGAHFARLMFRVVLDAVFERMPDFAVDRAGAVRYPSNGQVNGYSRLPATFTPGPRRG